MWEQSLIITALKYYTFTRLECKGNNNNNINKNNKIIVTYSTYIHILTCKMVHATNKTGSSSDDWIY
jgi:hypothetical protein